MERNIPIVIGEYYENFINKQIASGKYNAVIEVVRTYLRYFEQEETRTQSLMNELEIGESSEKVHDSDRNKNLAVLHKNFQK